MKKLKFFSFIILIGLIYFFYVNYFLPNKLLKITPRYFYLFLKEPVYNIDFKRKTFFSPIYRFNNIIGEDYFIKDLRLNLFTETITITNSIFSQNIIKSLKDVLKVFRFLNIDNWKIYLINTKTIILTKNEILNIYQGLIDIRKRNVFLNIIGKYGSLNFYSNGNIDNNLNISFQANITKVPFEIFYQKLLDLPEINILNFKTPITGEITWKGNIDNISDINFNGTYDNNIQLTFDISKSKIKNGKIIFLPSSSFVNFKGQILNSNIWHLYFFSNSNNLNIPFDNSTIILKNSDLAYSINSSNEGISYILKISGEELNGDKNFYHFLKKFFHRRNYIYTIYFDKVKIDNATIKNVDIDISCNNGKTSIDKFNFDIGYGKVLYSFITNNDKFQWAASLRNINLNKLVDFILNMNIPISGIFNVNFYAVGKDRDINSAKGYCYGKKIEIYGLTYEKLDTIFKDKDIFNLSLNSIDNSSILLINSINADISEKDNKIYFKKIIVKGDNFLMHLNGYLDLHDLNNLIFTGKYFSQDVNGEDIIINFNFKDKFIQFIGK